MSRSFRIGSVQYATALTPSSWKRAISAPPFTVFALFRPAVLGLTAGRMTVISFEDSLTSGEALVCESHGATGVGQGFSFRAMSGGTDKEAKVAMSLASTDTYAVWWRATSTADRACAVNNGTPVVNTVSIAPVINQCSIGRMYDGEVQTQLLHGRIERLRVWDVALTDAEMAAWGKDASGAGDGPWQDIDTCRPESMVWGWDMIRDQASDSTAVPDVIGGTTIVMSATPPVTAAGFPMLRTLRE